MTTPAMNVRLEMTSEPGCIGVVTENLEKFCRNHCLNEEEIHNMMIAVDEAVTNIVTHAYKGMDEGRITVNMSYRRGWLKVEMVDQGHELDFNRIPEERPSIDLDGDRLGGFGLYLMQHMVDRLSIEHDQQAGLNRLIMEKKMA